MISEVYLISSLPSLSFGERPPISLEEFDEVTRKELPGKSYAMLEAVNVRIADCKNSDALARKIYAILEEMHQEIDTIRQSKQRAQAATNDLVPGGSQIANPLEREKIIMKWLWDRIEDLESGKTFTLTEVVAYKLKLQILHRMHSFDKEKGIYILASILKNAEKSMS